MTINDKISLQLFCAKVKYFFGDNMKKNIHPEYHSIFVVLTNGEKFETKSVLGKPGDVINLDIDPFSHPAWTGSGSRIFDTKGQVSKFNKRYKNFGA